MMPIEIFELPIVDNNIIQKKSYETGIVSGEAFILNEHNDYLNNLPKAELIAELIRCNIHFFRSDKMIALYGGWGTGKSTVMKTIASKLQNKSFICYEFETWKYEKDNNLALSLLEFLLDNFEKTFSDEFGLEFNDNFEHISKDTFKMIKSKLIDKGKKILSKTKYNFFGLEISASDIASIFIKEKIERENTSLYYQIKEFEQEFIELENKILIPASKNIVVFIDDLDRCESENIINLLSAIKHFFNLGNRVIFMAGIDKTAVTKALQNKYGNDSEKAEEYLEKIFTMSFSLNENNYDLNLFLDKAFREFWENETPELFLKFLQSINFTNPRHLKKIANKLKLLNIYIKNPENLLKNKFSPFLIKNQQKDNFEIISFIILTYLLILKDFFPKYYNDLKKYELRFINYRNTIKLPALFFNSKQSIKFYFNKIKLSSHQIGLDIFKFENYYCSNELASLNLFFCPFPANTNSNNEILIGNCFNLLSTLENLSDDSISYKFSKFLSEEIVYTSTNLNDYNNKMDNAKSAFCFEKSISEYMDAIELIF